MDRCCVGTSVCFVCLQSECQGGPTDDDVFAGLSVLYNIVEVWRQKRSKRT